MLAMLKFEWDRMVHSTLFRIAVTISCLLSFISAMEQFSLYLKRIDRISVFTRWIGQMNINFASRYFFTVIPLIVSFAYSSSGCTDRKQGYIYQIITRTKRKQYFWSKYIISFIGGGIVFSAAVLLNLVILLLFMRSEIPDPATLHSVIDQFRFCSKLYYSSPFLFSALWLSVVFLWGGAISSIGVVAGMFSDNVFMAASVPFMVFVGEGVLSSYIMNKNIFTMGLYNLELCWTDMLRSGTPGAAPTDYIVSTIVFLIVLTLICYGIKVRKYECL